MNSSRESKSKSSRVRSLLALSGVVDEIKSSFAVGSFVVQMTSAGVSNVHRQHATRKSSLSSKAPSSE